MCRAMAGGLLYIDYEGQPLFSWDFADYADRLILLTLNSIQMQSWFSVFGRRRFAFAEVQEIVWMNYCSALRHSKVSRVPCFCWRGIVKAESPRSRTFSLKDCTVLSMHSSRSASQADASLSRLNDGVKVMAGQFLWLWQRSCQVLLTELSFSRSLVAKRFKTS